MIIIVNKSLTRPALLALFLFSGFAALAYQVLWVRQLALMFGSTAQAAALVIAVFFAGIATGSGFWGSRVGSRPLRTFGLLELGIAGCALAYFALAPAYSWLYPALVTTTGHDHLARVVIAAAILFPACFLMGGTLPAMTETLLASEGTLVRTGTALYAVNTAGGATGALAAGIFLPPIFGFNATYLIAVVIDVGVGIVALAHRSARLASIRAPEPRSSAHLPATVWVVAAVSGSATLGLEIVWTRLLSQVLQNSAYTYAIVLSTFLIALSVGALIARALASRPGSGYGVLLIVLAASTCVVGSTPWLFRWATDDLTMVGGQLDFVPYLGAVFAVAALVMLIPGAIVGTVLPYLLRLTKHTHGPGGVVIGRLVMVNTIGAIIGALVTAFVLLPVFGTTQTSLILAAAYSAIFISVALPSRKVLAVLGSGTLVALVMWSPAQMHTARLHNAQERLLEIREGPDATVSVIENGSHRVIRVNNSYTLGGTRSWNAERTQGLLPLLLHGDARSVFTLGMGTGITAGAVLEFPVERLLVCELISDVVTLSEKYFAPWTNGLFTDVRADIRSDDGRVCLSRSPEKFDVIISDLFTPWHAGTGNLYTVEHFETVRDRLNKDGVFAQWIPLYQVSDAEFNSLVRSMLEVFPLVTVWRGDFFPSRSIVAVVGHQNAAPHTRSSDLHFGLTSEEQDALLLRMYVGNATNRAGGWNAPANRDAHPFIEYSAPRTQRAVRSGDATFLVGAARERLYESFPPASSDSFLSALDETGRDAVRAGRALSKALWLAAAGRETEAAAAQREHDQRVPATLVGETSLARGALRVRE